MCLSVVILAAGHGKRMHSELPKVLHTIGGVPMLARVLKTAQSLMPDHLIMICGNGKDSIQSSFSNEQSIQWVEQKEQLGTGHALHTALPQLPKTGMVLVLYGDVPLIKADTLQVLLEKAKQAKGIGILTDTLQNPYGMGRILRDSSGHIIAIIEEQDATPTQKSIREVSTGILALPAAHLDQWLCGLQNNNAQQEYYLTDVIQLAVGDGVPIVSLEAPSSSQVMGVNTKQQLIHLERLFQVEEANRLLEKGVTIVDPHRFDLRGHLVCGHNVTIDVGCIIEGEVTLADDVTIGAYCILKNVTIDSQTTVAPFSHLDGATVGKGTKIGPYARLRPGTKLADGVHIGNFVEVKNSVIGINSKANHLTYLGDAMIGPSVNIGAGTITCNYDGVNKFKTTIKEGAFVGSGTLLIAPVTVAEDATIGAGSVITKNAPAHQLTLSRSPQLTLPHWKKSKKIK